MITTLIFYGLATYGGLILGRKIWSKVKQGNIKRQLLQSKTVKKLAGRK